MAADFVSFGEKGCYLQGRCFSRIVYVRLVTHSQQSELPYGRTNLPLNSLDGVLWHLVVQFARRPNYIETIDVLGQKPRIDGDAVASNADSRLQNVDARMFVRKLNRGRDVEPELIGNQGKFVRESDIDVAASVFHELYTLRGHEGCLVNRPLRECRIEALRSLCCFRRCGADDAVIVHNLM